MNQETIHQISFKRFKISQEFDPLAPAVIYPGSCLDLLKQIPPESIQLVITSPPYNIGKEYEGKLKLPAYIEQQAHVIKACAKALAPQGSLCWQTGNYVNKGCIAPLDTILYPIFSSLGLKMRNRIVWRFEHGLHCSKRFSGRYETIVWFTKSDNYTFNLDPVRVPQKYPGKKYFKGPRAGQYSCHPLGKNPGDVWEIPNVKHNHVEKTAHPCQFPVELVERLVLSLTNEGDWVLDPFLGSGTSLIAALKRGRRGAGAEINPLYIKTAFERLKQLQTGCLKTRAMNTPIHQPGPSSKNQSMRRKNQAYPLQTSLF